MDRFVHFVAVSLLSAWLMPDALHAADSQVQTGGQTTADAMDCAPIHAKFAEFTDLKLDRTVCADVVALDQTLVYNRFGSFNPYGMIFALRRDVASMDEAPKSFTADACDAFLGTEAGGGDLVAGNVRLKDCKRPRPLTLRANVGDLLHVRLDNLLRHEAPGISEPLPEHAGRRRQPVQDLARLGGLGRREPCQTWRGALRSRFGGAIARRGARRRRLAAHAWR